MVNPDSSYGVSRVVHHKDYYLRGGDMTVLVENHLYRIHSYFFQRESLFFRQKFGSESNSEETERGSTDYNAYTLEDVKSEDFARFLWVFYNPKYSMYDAPLETWLSILKLANRWTFDNVKELAVRELEKIDIEPVEKITTYHDNAISRLYLIPSYITVCKRDKPLSFTEGMKLGMETVLRIAEARERLRLQASESGIRTPTFEDFEDEEVEVLIREIFNLGSRPASPQPAISAPTGTNGVNGTIKLNPAPSGNPPKANGAPAPRASGGLAADPKGFSVDTLPSFASVLPPQTHARAPVTPATPASATHSTSQKHQVQAQVATTPLVASSPPPPPPASDKPKDNKDSKDNSETGSHSQESSSLATFLSPMSGGVGELPSSVESKQGGSHSDVLVSETVVPSSGHSNDVTVESNNNVNDPEKDESAKDNDSTVAFSDADGAKSSKGGKSKRGGRGGTPGRGKRGS